MPTSPRTLYARVSDDVLEEEDWGAFRLHVREDGLVALVEEVRPSVYGPPDRLVGRTIEQLAEWTCHDGTGRHPEVFHQLASTPDGPWRDRLHPRTVRQLLGGI